MLRKLLLPILLVAGVTVTGLLVLLPTDSPPPTVGPDVTSATDGADPSSRRGDPRAADTGADVAPDRIDVATPERGPNAPDSAVSDPGDVEDGVALRVLATEDQRPLSGAQVWILKEPSPGEGETDFDLSAPLAQQIALFEQLGARCPDTGVDGMTVLRAGRDGRSIVAARFIAADGTVRHGWKRLRMTAPPPLTLELGPPGDLRVRVTRADGSPAADVPIRLSTPGNGSWQEVWQGTTAANGTVAIDSVHARCLAAHREATPLREAAIGLRLLLAEPVYERIDLTDLPDEAIEFAMPSTGSISVIVDSLETAESNVTLERIRPTLLGDPMQHAEQSPTVDGRTRFDQVGLGLGLRVAAEYRNANEATEVEARGPVAPGQQVEVRVQMFGEKPVLRSRLVDADNLPITNSTIRVTATASRHQSSSESNLSMQTDAEGVVLFEPSDDLGPAAERHMKFLAEDRDLHTAADVPSPLRPGINDLGTLTMSAPPALVSGQVIDAAGEPVAGARVTLDGKVPYLPSNPDLLYWDRIGGAADESADDGRFVLTGATEASLLRVKVTTDGFVPQTVPDLPVGLRDLTITMQQAGELRGEILVPEADSPIRLEVRVVRPDGKASDVQSSAGGAFHFPSLEPGVVSFELGLFGYSAPLHTQRDLRIEGGETADIGVVDLTDALHFIRVTVVDAQGQPIPDAVALFAEEPPPGQDRSRFDGLGLKGGIGSLVTRRESVDLFVYAEGHRSVRAVGVRDGQQVVLPPAPILEIQVDPDALPPADSYRLSVRLTRRDDTWPTDIPYMVHSEQGRSAMSGGHPWDHRLAATVDAQGIARIEVPEPGAYDAQWTLRSKAPDGTAHGVEAGAQIFTVLDAPAPQQQTSTLTRSQLESAVPGGF